MHYLKYHQSTALIKCVKGIAIGPVILTLEKPQLVLMYRLPRYVTASLAMILSSNTEVPPRLFTIQHTLSPKTTKKQEKYKQL